MYSLSAPVRFVCFKHQFCPCQTAVGIGFIGSSGYPYVSSYRTQNQIPELLDSYSSSCPLLVILVSLLTSKDVLEIFFGRLLFGLVPFRFSIFFNYLALPRKKKRYRARVLSRHTST